MFYLINSQLRTNDQLDIETYNTIVSNTSNISMKNPLIFRPDALSVQVGNLLSSTTGESFISSIYLNSYQLDIYSSTCEFKFNFGNVLSNNSYNILGITETNNYTNRFISNNDINNNTPIFESNIISIDILKNSYKGTFNIYPPNYTIEGFCKQVKNTLILNTNLDWNVDIINSNINGNINDRILIDCLTSNYKFLFYWTSNVMYNISNSFGFSTDIQSNIFTSNIISDFRPLNNCFITSKDELYFNTEQTINNYNEKNYNISTETLIGSIFISNLQNLLNNNTNGSVWNVTISSTTKKITIKLVSNNNNTFIFLFSDPRMIRIAQCLGFNLVNTLPSTIITSEIDYDDRITFFESDKLLLNINMYTTNYNYNLYRIPLSTPLYNPVDCISQINSRLIKDTNVPWNIVSNNNSNISNDSYLKIYIDDFDSSFMFFWGNVYSNNLSKSLGFSNIDMNSYTNNIVGNNIIDFNSNLDINDKLYYNVRSNVYYTLTDYTIPSTNNGLRLNSYLLFINDTILNKTGHQYTFTLLSDIQRVQIHISSPNTTFKILFGQDQMKNIATMLGFEPINTPEYVNQIIGNKIVDYNTILTPSDILYITEKTINPPEIITPYSIPLTQPFFNSNNFIHNFSNILEKETNRNWSVTNNLNFLTINILSPNCTFNFLWGDINMGNISYVLGFNSITGNTQINTTTGQFTINKNITFTQNDILKFNIRDTTSNIEDQGRKQFSISTQTATFNTFLSVLASRLQSVTGMLFRIQNNNVDKKITIITDSSNTYFKILWSNVYMFQITKMLGFNTVDTPDWVKSVTSPNQYDESITLLTSNIFFIIPAVQTNINLQQIERGYQFNIQPMFFYPGYFFQYINNLINSDLYIPFSISYNVLTSKITLSSTSKFNMNFGNLYNLQQIMGFNFNISPSYEYVFTSDNKINMTLSVLTNDIIKLSFLDGEIKTYDINFYDFYANVHIGFLQLYMYEMTQLLWSCNYISSDKKMSISLQSNKFRLITTDPIMKNLCIIYGLDHYNLNPFDFIQVSLNRLSFSTYIDNKLVALQNPYSNNLIADPINIVIYSLQNNMNNPVLYSLPIEPILYTPLLLINYLQTLLNSKIPGLNFIVSYDNYTKKMTISNNSATYIQFRFLFGSSTFIDRYMGFNRSNINSFTYSITSEKEINLSSQFGQIIINPNSIINFNKLKLSSINLPKLENITYCNNFLTIIEKNGTAQTEYSIALKDGYYTDITIPLTTALNTNGLTGIYNVILSNNKITINVNSPIEFKILWNKNKILSNMCGFNPFEPTIFSNTITSDFLVDFVYPKYVYIDIFGLKYKSEILNNNKHVFIINLNSNDYNQFNTIINCPNNNMNRLIFTLYDENYKIISPVSNWEALFDFIQ